MFAIDFNKQHISAKGFSFSESEGICVGNLESVISGCLHTHTHTHTDPHTHTHTVDTCTQTHKQYPHDARALEHVHEQCIQPFTYTFVNRNVI